MGLGGVCVMKFIATLIGVIVAVMILVTTIGTTASIVDDGAEAVTQDARCTAGGCFWNATGSPEECQFNTTEMSQCNVTGIHTAYTGESLFNTGGIVILAFLGAALVATMGLIWRFKVKG